MTNLNMQSENDKGKHTEGPVARRIEEQTAKVPSDFFMWAAITAMAGSAVAQVMQPKHKTTFGVPTRRGQWSLFIGQWVPTLLIFGLYNKIVKVAGSDRNSRNGRDN